MGEGHLQSWATTRRGSNPRLEADEPIIVDIPPTPPFKNSSSTASFLSLILPFHFQISTSLTTALIIASWYFSNIGILILNKYLLSIHGYHYPIFLTALHMLSCSLYSFLSVHTLRLVSFQRIASSKQFYKIVTLSLIFCISVVCGNSSLRYLPVSFNQAIGATTPFFTAAFSFLLTCRHEEPLVYLTLVPIVLGIVLATNSEPLFHLLGFLFCVISTAGRALKSVIQGILLSNDSEKMNSINLLLYMAPIAAVALIPLSLYIEGNVATLTMVKVREDPRLLLLLFGNATVAYLVNLTNFLVTKHTSALTLQVLGNAKAAVAAVVSVMIFRNPVTITGILGFGITIGGVVLYSEARKRTRNNNSYGNSTLSSSPLLGSSNSASS